MSLFIFDLDGTLIDSLEDLTNSCNYALQLHGFPLHQQDRYKLFVGNGVRKLVERALPASYQDESNIERVLATFLPYYEKHSRDRTAPYEGILPLLHWLKLQGHLISIASNKYHKAVLELVPYYFSDIHFDLVLGHREGYLAKPDPQIVLDTLSTLGVDKEDCFYLGDSSVDMLTAKNASVKAIGVTWGFRTEEELKTSGADIIIHHPSELENALA